MLSGLGMISDDDIIDTLRHIAYPTILQKYRNSGYEFLVETNTSFSMMPLNKDTRHLSFTVEKNPTTGELLKDANPVTFEQTLVHIKNHWTSIEREISNDLHKFLVDNLLEYTFPAATRPENYVIHPYTRTPCLDYRIKDNKKIEHKIRMAAKGIRATITKQGYNDKVVMSVFAGKYINWLGREDSQYLYAKLGKKVKAEAYNLLQRDRKAYKYYMDCPETKNWTIAVSMALGKESVGHVKMSKPGDFTSLYENNNTSTRDLIVYAKSHWLSLCPYYEDKVFQTLSPRLIKDTYNRYPKQLHRLVALVAEHGIDTPTYTMSKKLIYKDHLMHTTTIELASAISNAAKLDYKTTQQHAIDQFVHQVRHGNDEEVYVPEWPDYVPPPPHEEQRLLDQLEHQPIF